MIYAPDNSDNSVSFSNSTTNNNNDKDKDTKDSKDSKDSSSSSESKDASSSSTSGSSSSSSASSSTASSSESKASTESSKEKELTDDAFQDKVQSEFRTRFINKNVQVVLHGLSSHMQMIRMVKMLNIRRTLKAKPFTFKVKRQRLKILLMDLKMVPKRKSMPRLSLKRFMTPLTEIVRCQILSSQNMPKFR